LEEEDEWGGEGEGWRVRVLNAGVIAESSERVQWHSMSPWSYCMTHSTQRQRHTHYPSLSLSTHGLREKMWTWRERHRRVDGTTGTPYTYGSGIRASIPGHGYTCIHPPSLKNHYRTVRAASLTRFI
jgi:hypothetical protein